MISSDLQLEERLSLPNEADIQAVKELKGPLVILGAGGKMGPTLAVRARRAIDAAGSSTRVYAASRYSSDGLLRSSLEAQGVTTIASDLLDRDQVNALPDAENVIFLAGRKFGSTGGEALTWAMNTHMPALVAERYRAARIIALSSGNVYPFMPVSGGGATERTPPGPLGEYAQSVLGRERIFHYFSERYRIPTLLVRLNYAVELRYGVLLDIGLNVFERVPVDLAAGLVNVIWQGDANSVCLRAFSLCQSPPAILNLTGPETLSVRQIAQRFGEIFGVVPQFVGSEPASALISSAAKCHGLFGYPSVQADRLIEWTAHWIGRGGRTLAKPTHFEARDGKF